MVDLSMTVVPKSDQMNADDLIAGPRTITITRITASDTPEQPVSVYFEGDNGKPWKPCKSMRRVLIAAWGADASKFAGRSVTLYNDPDVQFGGMKLGGIRISHMSHLDGPLKLALTTTKSKRAMYAVKQLATRQVEPEAPPAMSEADAIAAINATTTLADLQTTFTDLFRNHRATADLPAVKQAKDDRKAALTPDLPPAEDDEIPL